MLNKFDEKVIDITAELRAVLGNTVKQASLGTTDRKRSIIQDELIIRTKSGYAFHPDWDGMMYILFENGSEIEISGSDYVSVIARNVNLIEQDELLDSDD